VNWPGDILPGMPRQPTVILPNGRTQAALAADAADVMRFLGLDRAAEAKGAIP
jgi:hypothetical protein